MQSIREKMGAVYNIGLADRSVRFIVGFALLGAGAIGMTLTPTITTLEAVAVIVSIYPLMTSMLGWDPFYSLFGARTCSLEGGRNQCGTFPYEVDAALGHDPEPDKGFEYDHSLSGSHHQRQGSTAHRKVA